MGNAEQFKQAVRRCYAARVAGDLDGTLACFTEDASFQINAGAIGLAGLGDRVEGKAAVREAIKELIDNFKFTDWTEVSFLVEGEQAALHWRANVTFVPNGRTAPFEIADVIQIRDGKIAHLFQSTDSAMLKAMLTE